MSEIETFAATSPFSFGDRVVQTTQTTGTGDITLLIGPVGMVRFQDEFALNIKFYYWLESEGKEQWEHGVGYLSNASRMVRETIIKTSEGTTDPIDLPSGTSLIWSATGADAIVTFDGEGGIDGRKLSVDGAKLDLLTITQPFNLDTYEPTTLNGLSNASVATPSTIMSRNASGSTSVLDLYARNIVSSGTGTFAGKLNANGGLKVTGASEYTGRGTFRDGITVIGDNNFYPESGSQYAFQSYFNKDNLLKFTFYTSDAGSTALSWRTGDGITNTHRYGVFLLDGNIRIAASVVPSNGQDLTTKAYVDGAISTVSNAKAPDSNLLDGLDSTSFLRGDAHSSINAGKAIRAYSSLSSYATGSAVTNALEVYNQQGYSAMMTFHIGGQHATYFGLNTANNKLSVGGWSAGSTLHEIYHSGNKDSSKLDVGAKAADADKLDNISSGSFARYDAAPARSNGLCNTGWVTSYSGASNVDHIRHSDGNNTWYFCSDTSFTSSGNSVLSCGSVTATGNVAAFSDERIKSDFNPITDALEIVCSWQGEEYDKLGKREVGFRAQSIQKRAPLLVTEVDLCESDENYEQLDGKLLALDYGRTAPYLVEALKSQQAIIEQLTARLEALEAKV